MSCLLTAPTDEIVQRMVEDYFDIENFGVKLVPPVAGSVVLPPRYDIAYMRLVNVEKKMKRNGQLAQA